MLSPCDCETQLRDGVYPRNRLYQGSLDSSGLGPRSTQYIVVVCLGLQELGDLVEALCGATAPT